MKQILMCLLLIFGCAIINPIYSMASEDRLDFSYLTVDNSNHVTNIEIMSGVTGETINITSKQHIAEILSIIENDKFIEYEKEGNAGGWAYKIKIRFDNRETPFEYIIDSGFTANGKNYKLEDVTDLKEAVAEAFNDTTLRNVISVSSENGTVEIKVNNVIVEFTVSPFVDEFGRTQVPVRELCEYLNKRVYWYDNPQRIAISKVPADLDNTNGGSSGDGRIQFVIGESKYTIDGKEYQMDTSAKIINGKTYVPLRVIGEFLNYKVTWQE